MTSRKRAYTFSRTQQNLIIVGLLLLAGALMVLTSNRLNAPADAPLTLDGRWVGTMTEDYGDFTIYNTEFDILHRNGEDDLRGTIYYLDDSDTTEREAWSAYVGKTDGTTIHLREKRVLDVDNIELQEWCMIKATLQYQSDTGRLVGNWQGIPTYDVQGCDTIQGRIYLERADSPTNP